MEKQTVLEKLEQLEKTHESRQSKTKLQHDIGKEQHKHMEIQYGSLINHLLNFIVNDLCPTPVLLLSLFLIVTNCFLIFLLKVVERNV